MQNLSQEKNKRGKTVQVIEVPTFGEDGSITVVNKINPQEAQLLLQFAINFLISAGVTLQEVSEQAEQEQNNPGLND